TRLPPSHPSPDWGRRCPKGVEGRVSDPALTESWIRLPPNSNARNGKPHGLRAGRNRLDSATGLLQQARENGRRLLARGKRFAQLVLRLFESGFLRLAGFTDRSELGL